MGEFFEVLMIVSFGASWPFNVLKSYRAGTAKGKSLAFLVIIFFGYLFGITGKFLTGNINYVLIFYVINTIMVGADILLYFRNLRYDREEEAQRG